MNFQKVQQFFRKQYKWLQKAQPIISKKQMTQLSKNNTFLLKIAQIWIRGGRYQQMQKDSKKSFTLQAAALKSFQLGACIQVIWQLMLLIEQQTSKKLTPITLFLTYIRILKNRQLMDEIKLLNPLKRQKVNIFRFTRTTFTELKKQQINGQIKHTKYHILLQDGSKQIAIRFSFVNQLKDVYTINPQIYWFSKDSKDEKLYTYFTAFVFITTKPITTTYFDSLLPQFMQQNGRQIKQDQKQQKSLKRQIKDRQIDQDDPQQKLVNNLAIVKKKYKVNQIWRTDHMLNAFQTNMEKNQKVFLKQKYDVLANNANKMNQMQDSDSISHLIEQIQNMVTFLGDYIKETEQKWEKLLVSPQYQKQRLQILTDIRFSKNRLFQSYASLIKKMYQMKVDKPIEQIQKFFQQQTKYFQMNFQELQGLQITRYGQFIQKMLRQQKQLQQIKNIPSKIEQTKIIRQMATNLDENNKNSMNQNKILQQLSKSNLQIMQHLKNADLNAFQKSMQVEKLINQVKLLNNQIIVKDQQSASLAQRYNKLQTQYEQMKKKPVSSMNQVSLRNTIAKLFQQFVGFIFGEVTYGVELITKLKDGKFIKDDMAVAMANRFVTKYYLHVDQFQKMINQYIDADQQTKNMLFSQLRKHHEQGAIFKKQKAVFTEIVPAQQNSKYFWDYV